MKKKLPVLAWDVCVKAMVAKVCMQCDDGAEYPPWLPRIEVGAVSIPVDHELHCAEAFPIAAMRENAGNDILIAVKIAKRGNTVR